MKVFVTFKTPDALHEAAREAAKQAEEQAAEDNPTWSVDEIRQVYTDTYEKIMDAGREWISGGEYITVELGVDTGTCTVKPR